MNQAVSWNKAKQFNCKGQRRGKRKLLSKVPTSNPRLESQAVWAAFVFQDLFIYFFFECIIYFLYFLS